MSGRPLENITGRELALALLDEQALFDRPMSLDDALLGIGAAWRCKCAGPLWLRGQACRLCHRCICGDRADPNGTDCPICGYRLD